MILSLIVAADEANVIGAKNALPWYLPADLQHFKTVTMGHPIIMGRKTHESIGKALPGRQNIVITHQEGFAAPSCDVVPSLDVAIAKAEEIGAEEAFIIGGGQIFAESMGLADRLYLTRVHHRFPGDIVFPAIDLAQWKEVSAEHHESDEKNPHAYTFFIYERHPAPLEGAGG